MAVSSGPESWRCECKSQARAYRPATSMITIMDMRIHTDIITITTAITAIIIHIADKRLICTYAG